MATLTIRNLPDDVHDALRRRAAEHRRSMEAEAREVLQAAVASKPTDQQRREAIARIHRMTDEVNARRGAPHGWSFTDAFVADRRLEAAWEDGRVTDAERSSWMERLERFDVTPEALEAFVHSRTPQP